MTKKQMNQLENKINKYRESQQQRSQELNEKFHSNSAFKILVDILSGIAVGVFLGYILDIYLGTIPMALFLFAILGMVGGVYNVYKDFDRIEKEGRDKDE